MLNCKSLVRFAGCFCFILFCLYWFMLNPRLIVLVTEAALCLVFLLIVANDSIRISDNAKYLLLLLFFCLLMCFVFTPFSVPDEAHHFFSSYWLLDMLPGGHGVASDGFYIRSSDYDLYRNTDPYISGVNYNDLIKGLFSTTSNLKIEKFSEISYTFGSENIPAKIGSLVGLFLGLSFNLNSYLTFYLGRIGSIVVFVACSFFAFKTAPKGKCIIAFVSFLPMTLHLAASYSYDSGIIGYSLIVFSLLMKGFFSSDGHLDSRFIALVFLFSALLAPCKVIYSGIICLFLLIPLSKFKSKRDGKFFKIGLVFVMLTSVILFRTASIASLTAQSGQSVRGLETGTFYTLSDIIFHPRHSFKMLMATFDSLGDFYWLTTLGYSLGWFQKSLIMPTFLMLPYLVFGFMCLVGSALDDRYLAPKVAVAFVVAFLVAFAGAFVSMWIGWTFNTEELIMGVQGRYFLPALPVLMFGLRTAKVRCEANVCNLVLYGTCLANCIYIVRLISIAAL